MEEAHAVINYVKKLLSVELKGRKVTQADIGIVVPYKLQLRVIKGILRRLNFNDITVGTAEVFQGQERPIMIITTVRTDGKLGFLSDPRVSSF